MRITKFVHSCVLVETPEAAVLFDPGVYSYESGTIEVNSLPELTHLVITHEHADHFHLPFVTELCERFQNLIIVTTEGVAASLRGKVKASIHTESVGPFVIFKSPHENLPTGMPPQNIGVHFLDSFTHPGDSHSFSETKKILAMPMTAPWGSMTAAMNKIVELKPEVVIPIHDWHWRPEALDAMYIRLKEVLAKQNIDFIIPKDGQAVEL